MARVSFNCTVLLVLLTIDISLGQGFVDEASQLAVYGPPAMDRRICECGAAFSPFRAHSPPLPRDRKPAARTPEHSER